MFRHNRLNQFARPAQLINSMQHGTRGTKYKISHIRIMRAQHSKAARAWQMIITKLKATNKYCWIIITAFTHRTHFVNKDKRILPITHKKIYSPPGLAWLAAITTFLQFLVLADCSENVVGREHNCLMLPCDCGILWTINNKLEELIELVLN